MTRPHRTRRGCAVGGLGTALALSLVLWWLIAVVVAHAFAVDVDCPPGPRWLVEVCQPLDGSG